MPIVLQPAPKVSNVAEQVLSMFQIELQTNAHKHVGEDRRIETEYYLNGRERGYALIYHPPHGAAVRTAAFAQYRSIAKSEDIVVYYGDWNAWVVSSQFIPTEETCLRRRKFFSKTEYDKAAQFLYRYLIEGNRLLLATS